MSSIKAKKFGNIGKFLCRLPWLQTVLGPSALRNSQAVGIRIFLYCQIVIIGSPLMRSSFAEVPAGGAATSQAGDPAFPDEIMKMRDPFKQPILDMPDIGKKSELEQYPINSMKVVGILTGPHRRKALLQTPTGKTLIVGEKSKVGTRGGVVKKILPESVEIIEKVVNVLGREEHETIELELVTSGKRISVSQ